MTRQQPASTIIASLLMGVATIAVLLTGLQPLPVRAQAAAEPDTIIVTARKREEELQDVPVAVSAFTAEQIETRQIRDIGDVARFAPGLNFARAFGRTTERPVIRGLGNVLAGVQFGVESGTAYFVDGVYYPGDLQSLDIKSIERVEVIRGPQSALYGRNTYAGAINFVTKSPADSMTVDTGLRIGEDGEAQINAGISGQLVDGVLGGSLNARYYTFDGEFTNRVTGRTVGDEETTSVSGMLEWQPTENLRLRTRVSVQDDDDGTRPFFLQSAASNNCYEGTRSLASWPATTSTNRFQYYCGEINRPGDYVELSDGPAAGGQPTPIPGLPDVGYGPGANLDIYQTGQGVAFSGVERELVYASLLSEWDIGGSGWTLSTSGAWRDEERKTGSDSDHSAVNFISAVGNEAAGSASEIGEADDYSLEARLDSPQEERLRWMVGVFGYDQSIDTRDITFALPGGGPVFRTEETKNWAGFGSVEFDFTDSFTTTLELRYFDEEKTTREPGATGGAYDESVDFSETAPRLTADWQITDDLLFYGIYAKGYKPGGLNGVAGRQVAASQNDPSLLTYKQEESDNYEIGFKSTLLDGALTANIAVFFIDAQDIQLTTPLSNQSLFGALTSIVTNQGDGEVIGGEIELAYDISDSLRVGANYSLADTEFTSGCDEFQWILTNGGGNPASGNPCTGNNLNGRGNGSIEGKSFPLSAKNQFSATIDFDTQINDSWDFFAGADYSWEDRKPVQVHNEAWVPDATIVNARIGVSTRALSVSVYGRNLTDEDAPSMVTRWLQYPLASAGAGGVGGSVAALPSDALLGASCGAPAGGCSVNFPRAFFGDMRRGRNFGLEVSYRFGGDD